MLSRGLFHLKEGSAQTGSQDKTTGDLILVKELWLPVAINLETQSVAVGVTLQAGSERIGPRGLRQGIASRLVGFKRLYDTGHFELSLRGCAQFQVGTSAAALMRAAVERGVLRVRGSIAF